MPTLHGFACKNLNFPHPAAPALARPESLHAPALKAPQEAGRRGGESIAPPPIYLKIRIIFKKLSYCRFKIGHNWVFFIPKLRNRFKVFCIKLP